MPGITGIIGNASKDPSIVEAMLGCMMHESYYRSGFFFNERPAVRVGWTTFQGEFFDCLPIWNETADVCLIFSGEDYAASDTRSDLRSRGHSLKAKADYLVHSYEENGLEFLEKINGPFCGLLIDRREKKVFLFNDRFGLKRLYYHENQDGFFFSSEAKSLLRVLPETRGLDSKAVAEFFSCGCALQNGTLFSQLSLSQGGSVWVFPDDGAKSQKRYFEKSSWENQPALPPEPYYEQLRQTFGQAVKRCLATDQRLGISLTGGVDSRMVMASAHVPEGGMPAYTFGGTYRDSVDVQVARQVAEICGQSHQVIEVGTEFLAAFPALAERTVYLSDGVMDVSGAADLFVNQIAREIAPVRVTGNYGGEILRHLVAFKPIGLHGDFFHDDFAPHVRAAPVTYRSELQDGGLSFVAFKQVPWHHYSRLALEASQITMRSPYLDTELVKLIYQAPPAAAVNNDLSLRLIAEENPRLGEMQTDRGLRRRPIPFLSSLLHFYQNFTFKAEYAYDYGMPRWLTKTDNFFRALRLERLFLGRHKFHHFRIWYRRALSKYLQEVLLDPRSLARPYLKRGRLERMVNDHVTGKGNYTLEIHRILTMELLQRQLIERFTTQARPLPATR